MEVYPCGFLSFDTCNHSNVTGYDAGHGVRALWEGFRHLHHSWYYLCKLIPKSDISIF